MLRTLVSDMFGNGWKTLEQYNKIMSILDKIKRLGSRRHDNRHPAKTMSFNKLYKGLMKRVDAGHINVQRSEDLEIFSYSKSCTFDGAWDKFTTMARGLILCPKKKKITGLCFPKFWNYGEVSTKLPDLGFRAFTKYDGSLGICYYHRDRWRVATRGSFQSDQAVWATDYLNKHASLSNMDPNITYLTEIIAPWNKIVISYSFSGLVLLSGYYLNSGVELTRNEVLTETTAVGFTKSKEENYASLDDMLAMAKVLDISNEGFVVRFYNGYRIKIKCSEYCRVHKLISNCTPLAIWDMMRNRDCLDTVRAEYPEEFHKDFDQIIALLQKEFDDRLKDIKDFYEDTKILSAKELGLKLKSGFSCRSVVARKFVFACRNKNFLTEVHETPDGRSKHARKTLFETFRPTGNVLKGFKQSSAMDRFSEESL